MATKKLSDISDEELDDKIDEESSESLAKEITPNPQPQRIYKWRGK